MASPKGHAAYNTKGEGGRPRTYTTEVIEKEAEALMIWLQVGGNIYFNKFALERGYDPDYMSEWAEENERFRGAYKMAKKWQELYLLEGATKKELSDGFTKFVLINNHGYADKTESKITTNETESSFIIRIVDGSTKDMVNDGKEKV